MNTAYTPERICKENKSLFVPIYQRLFVWDGKQIMRLLEDLFAVSPTEEDYYVGIVTIRERSDGSWEIVDGQQRLTFFSLFAAMQCVENPECVEEWKNFLFLPDKEGVLRIDYAGRPSDRKDIKLLAGRKDIEKSNDKSDEVVNVNMRRFRECWTVFKRKYKVDYSCLGKYVYKHASFLVSCLPGNYSALDLNRFFEKMNSAGKQLTVCDVIKGTYFPENAEIFDDCLNFDKGLLSLGKRYEDFKIEDSCACDSEKKGKSIRDVLNESGSDKEEPKEGVVSRIGARSLLSDEMLLLHVLYLITCSPNSGPTLDKGPKDLADRFKDFGKEKLRSFLFKLVEYRKWLDENIVHIEYDVHGRASYELGYSDSPDEYADQTKLAQFQSMMYVSSSEKQDWILAAYLAAKDRRLCLQDLKEIDRAAHPLPQTIDSMRYPAIDRYWFWRLDYILWNRYFEAASDKSGVNWDSLQRVGLPQLEEAELEHVLRYVFRPNRSIEHLHPQTPQDVNAEAQDWREEREKDRGGMVDSVGNLAMISSSLNSAQQNDGVGIKFERLKEKMVIGMGGLESIKMYVMFKLAKENPESWSVKLSEEHGAKMFELLKNEMADTMENTNVA